MMATKYYIIKDGQASKKTIEEMASELKEYLENDSSIFEEAGTRLNENEYLPFISSLSDLFVETSALNYCDVEWNRYNNIFRIGGIYTSPLSDLITTFNMYKMLSGGIITKTEGEC